MDIEKIMQGAKFETFTQIEAAERQIDLAIFLFLEKQDFICAITLACAAEGVLGEALSQKGETPLIEMMKPAIKEHLPELSSKEINDQHLNRVRNLLKHASSDIYAPIEAAVDLESIQVIVRAASNFALVTERLTKRSEEFFRWLKANKPEVLTQGSRLGL